MNPFTLEPDFGGEGLHVGIVRARFNEQVGAAQLRACLDELGKLGSTSVTSWWFLCRVRWK